MQRQPLPEDLGDAFHVRDAQACGVTRSRLRAGDLDHPFRGVYAVAATGDACSGHADVPTPTREDEIIARAKLAALQMGAGAFFSHVTSAVIWGVPLPHRVLDDVLDVGVFHPARPPRASGIRGHRCRCATRPPDVHEGSGLVVASPASTWAMLGPRLSDPYDLVAAAEALISDRRFGVAQPLAALSQLEAAVSSGRRVGIVALRAALARVRPHVASRTETWTRLTLVDAGLPEPEINYTVLDALAVSWRASTSPTRS